VDKGRGQTEKERKKKVYDVCMDDTVTPQLQGHVLVRSAEKVTLVPGRKFDEFVNICQLQKNQLLSFLKLIYLQALTEIRDSNTFRRAPCFIFTIQDSIGKCVCVYVYVCVCACVCVCVCV